MVGKSLSHYKILSELGRGGMGVVYKGEDTKLHRTVAIKVLPAAALSSDDDRARFYREARAAASLSHPNIAVIHEIDEAVPSDAPHGTEASPFIAMEFIEGDTLEDRIKQGPMKLEEAVRIAGEIASGLEAAHKKDIVHRDIKAANVMMDGDGRAKILDFGLAQTAQSTKLTRMGSTLGTVAYMSPEQARGEEVDARTDLWSLGAVLYEMIAGKSPFPGDYEQAVVYEILNQDPEPLTGVRTGVPMSLEWIVSKCLAKKAVDRYQTATDLLVDLRNVDLSSSGMSRVSSLSQPTASIAQAPSKRSLKISKFAYGIIALSIVASASAAWLLKPNPVYEFPSRQFIAVDPTLVAGISEDSKISSAAISPDGSAIAFEAEGRLWVRQLGKLEATEVRGVADREFSWSLEQFIWSPDSKSLVYSDPSGYIRVMIDSKEALLVASRPEGANQWQVLRSGGVAAKVEDVIIGPLSVRGQPQTLAGPVPGSEGHSFIELPKQKGFLTFRTDSLGVSWLSHALGEQFEDLIPVPTGSGVSSSSLDERGYLVYFAPDANERISIYALPLDLVNINVTGEPILIAYSGQNPSISRDGTMVYAKIPIADSVDVLLSENGLLSRRTISTNLVGAISPELSPNSDFLAMSVYGKDSEDIWLLDLLDGGYFQLSHDVEGPWRPEWSSDGTHITYQSRIEKQGSAGDIYVQAVGGGDPVALVTGPENDDYPAWSPDGTWIVYSHSKTYGSLKSIRRIRADGSGEAEVLIEDPQGASFASISPDGKYVVYQSNRGDEKEIFVATYPEGTRRTKISTGGGEYPKWRGNRIYWHDYDNNIVAVTVETKDKFTHGSTERFASSSELGVEIQLAETYMWDVSRDGKTLVVLDDLSRTGVRTVIAVENWLATVDFE